MQSGSLRVPIFSGRKKTAIFPFFAFFVAAGILMLGFALVVFVGGRNPEARAQDLCPDGTVAVEECGWESCPYNCDLLNQGCAFATSDICPPTGGIICWYTYRCWSQNCCTECGVETCGDCIPYTYTSSGICGGTGCWSHFDCNWEQGCLCVDGSCECPPPLPGGPSTYYSCTGVGGACTGDPDGGYITSNCNDECIIVYKPTISLNPNSFIFSGVSGGSTPAGQTMTISNVGNAQLNWTGVTNQGWCHISAASGVLETGASQNVTVSVDAPSNVGNFNCTIAVSDPNATNDPQTASVVYTVAESPLATCDNTWRKIPNSATVPMSSGNKVVGVYIPASSLSIYKNQIGAVTNWKEGYWPSVGLQTCNFGQPGTNPNVSPCTWSGAWQNSNPWVDADQWNSTTGIFTSLLNNNWNVYMQTNLGTIRHQTPFSPWNSIVGETISWNTPHQTTDAQGRVWDIDYVWPNLSYRCPPLVSSGSISASPNPCTITSPATTCISTITWSTQNVADAKVVVRETGALFSENENGSQAADWIGVGGVNFDLINKAGGLTLASVFVSGQVVNQPPSVGSVTVTEPDYCTSGPAAHINWTYSDPEVNPQSAYQVQVDDQGSAWNTPYTVDTGKVTGSGTSYFTGGGVPPWAWNVTYKARVRVWDSQDNVSGWKESGSWKTPKHAYPLVDFTYFPSTDIPAGQPVQFTDQTTFYDGGGTRTWSWLFKAPAPSPSSALQNPTYTYTSAGNYQVSETVTDKDGYTCPRTEPITIAQPVPVWKEVSPK